MEKKPFLWIAAGAVSVLLLASCGVHGLHMATSPLLKLLTPRSGRIAYLGIDGNVRIADQSGAAIQVTKDGQTGSAATTTYLPPVWSSDGKHIVFARFSQKSPLLPPTVDLFTANRNGKRVTDRFSTSLLQPFYFYWSPDSKKITLLSQIDGDTTLELGIVSVSPPRSYRRLDRGSPYYWVWLPNSRSIVAHRIFPNPLEVSQIGVPAASSGQAAATPQPASKTVPLSLEDRVSIIDVEGAVSIKNLPLELSSFQAPGVSSDGRKLLVVTGKGGSSSLTLFNLASGASRRLARLTGTATFAFSPNGRKVAYLEAAPTGSSDAKQPTTVAVLHVIGLKHPARSFDVKGRPVVAYYWSPNSRELAYLTPLAQKATIDPIFARNNRLLYVQLMVTDVNTQASWIVAQFPLTRGMFNDLPFNDQFQRSATIWSPNGKYLVFTAFTSQGTPGVFVVQADGNLQPTLVVPGDFASWSWK